MRQILENCLAMADRFNRIPHFFLTGGDPLLHPDFWTLLDLFKRREIEFSLLGNPFHLTSAICEKLAAAGCEKYQLSLDGLEKTHDWFRKPGSFQATLAALPLLKQAGITTAIMTTVSSQNMAEVPDIYRACIEHEADLFAFARYCPPGNANDLDPDAYRALLVEIQKISEENEDAATFMSRKDHLWTLLDWEQGRFKIPTDTEPGMIYDGCNCGNCHLTILPDGEVLACRRIPGAIVGNALRDNLAEIWLNQMEKYRDFSAFKKCGNCQLLAYCRGCPAVAASPDGDFYAADPQCWKKSHVQD